MHRFARGRRSVSKKRVQFREVKAQEKSGEALRPTACFKSKVNLIGIVYFFLSSFLGGLHFSQTFLFLAASTQHLWVHSLPAFLASSQQLAWRLAEPANQTKVQATRVNSLMLFIFLSFLCRDCPADQTIHLSSTRHVGLASFG